MKEYFRVLWRHLSIVDYAWHMYDTIRMNFRKYKILVMGDWTHTTTQKIKWCDIRQKHLVDRGAVTIGIPTDQFILGKWNGISFDFISVAIFDFSSERHESEQRVRAGSIYARTFILLLYIHQHLNRFSMRVHTSNTVTAAAAVLCNSSSQAAPSPAYL